MAGRYITVSARDGGSFKAYLATPEKGSGPGIVLLQAARAWRDTGAAPPLVDDPAIYFTARSGVFVSAGGMDWRDAYAQQVGTAARPVPMQQAAE